jgi:alpha-tubulin suppressor-like RCC1 family protein/predicted flap endonuclease-1-like 5' DNA nuclease
MTPFADQDFNQADRNEKLNEEIVMSTGNTGNADSIAFGLQSGCAIGASGNIKCWGDGSEGQLGLGNTQNIGDSTDETGTDLPFVNLGTNASVDKIVMGEDHSCALFTNGSVKCWGESSVLGLGYSSSNGGFGDGYLETGDTLPFLQLPTNRHATMIEAGKSHTCAVMDNNDLICWGNNSKGQIGIGAVSSSESEIFGDASNEIGDNFYVTSVPTGRTIDSMALGWDHTCVVWDNYSVSCWGGNDHGQLGLDSTTDIGDGAGEMGDNLDFIDLPGTASAITAGDGFTCAIVDDSGTDKAFCWGLNDFGQLGIESTTNVGDGSGGSMSSISNADLSEEVQAIDAGEDHVCAIVLKGSSYRPVQCWGNGADGRLGYGSQDSRGTGPGSASGMGSNLPYVRLNSGNTHYAYTATDIEVGAGTSCVIKYQGNNDIICWGDNGIGQLGYGDTEDRGDGQTDLPFVTELSLKLDEEGMENSCEILGVPEHRTGLDKRLDTDSSDTGDLISMFEIPTTGCPAIAYYDSGSDNLKFAAYDNGMWSVETLGSYTRITDIDLVVDSNGIPHIMHLNATYNMGDNGEPVYTTKTNGIWTESTLQGGTITTNLSLSIDSSDSITLTRYYETAIPSYTFARDSCSTDCGTWSNWNQDSNINQDTAYFETANGHEVFIDNSQNGLYYRPGSGTSPYLVSREVSQSDTYMVASIDAAPDGTVGIAHTNDTTYKTYFSYCSSTCSTLSSWTTELVSTDTSSEVVLQYDADGTPWILLTHNTTGATLFKSDNGQWDGQAISTWPGAADSFGMIINSAGYIFTSLHLVNPGELWAVTNPAIAGAGLYIDADGDGWTGLEELSCGTDRMVSSSIPGDFDEDGRCDRMDTVNSLPSVGDSSVLTQGMDFACAILDDGEIYCWGDNTYGKLGGSGSSASWPTGFEAVDVDAGESHACALSSAGEILCWGRNNKGQIGIGSTSSSENPTLLTLPNNHVAANLAVGANHNCITTTTSQIYCWGDGEDSQTGEYYVPDTSAGYNDDFEASTAASFWTLEGSTGTFGDQWALDSTDSSSGSNSFKSSGHVSGSDVGFSITKMFMNGTVSFDYKTATCPNLNNCNDKLLFTIDGDEINSTKGQMSNWASFNTSIDSGMHTLRWSFVKDGQSNNDGGVGSDYVAVDNIQIRTGFRVESGGIVDSPEVMSLNLGGLPEEIVAGERHTCLTNHLGEIWCMGYNGGSNRMVLGNSSTTGANSSSLVQVDIGFGTNSVGTVTAGYDTSCAILDNSTQAVCWGQRDDWSDTGGSTRSGELLLGSSSPSNSGTVADLGFSYDDDFEAATISSEWTLEGSSGQWALDTTDASSGTNSFKSNNHATDSNMGFSITRTFTSGSVSFDYKTDTCPNLNQCTDRLVFTIDGVEINSSKGQMINWASFSTNITEGEHTLRWSYLKDGLAANDASGDDVAVDNIQIRTGNNDRIYSIAMGESHACAIVENTIQCWGVEESGSFGQGSSTTAAYSTPQTISVPSGWTAKQVVIEHSTDSTCGIFENSVGSSSVMCWGDETAVGYSTSNPVTAITYMIPVEDSNGDDIIPSDDSISPYDIVDLQSGSSHTCALSRQGLIKCWGSNQQGQLGIAGPGWNTIRLGDNANEMGINLPYIDLGANVTATQISVGMNHNCAIVQSTTDSSMNGKVMCWGHNNKRQTLLTGSAADHEPNPRLVNAFGNDVVKIAAANEVTCALKIDGEIHCMGRDSERAIGTTSSYYGQGPATTLEFSSSGKFIDLYASSHSAGAMCATSVSGAIKCWGQGSYISQTSVNPVVFYDVNGIISSDLSFGEQHACMVVGTTTQLHETTSPLTNAGDIVCWGDNAYGKLGIGSTTDLGTHNNILTARPIDFNGTKMTYVESSIHHNCAISVSGEVYCWGSGSDGKIGYENTNAIGDDTNELPFLNAVVLEGSAKLLALTSTSTCAVMTDNEVYCWGDGSSGRTGHENSVDIGGSSNQMGVYLAPTDLHMRPTDFDLDGTIDTWDTDDDNDGALDVDDDFRLDPCAVLDTDSDGMPDLIYPNCTTTLVEDLDDDNDNWNDTVEEACITNSKDWASIPRDLDADGTCDTIDTDDDGDGWSDVDEQACERKEWGERYLTAQSNNWGYGFMSGYGTGVVFLPNDHGHLYQTLGLDNNARQLWIYGFKESESYVLRDDIYNTGGSQQGFDYESYGQGVYVVNDEELLYLNYNSNVNHVSNSPSEIYTFDITHVDQHHDLSISSDGTVYMTTHDMIVRISSSGETEIAYPSGVSNSTSDASYKQIAVDSNGDVHLLAYHEVASRIYTWIYDTSSESWNSGIDSGSGSVSDVGPGRSSFAVDSSNQPHLALMKGSSATDSNSYLTYQFYDNSGSNWVSRFTDQTPSGYNGISLELDSNNDIHLAWVDNGNKSLYYTKLSSTSNAQSTTLVQTASGSNSYWDTSHKSLELTIGAGDDPWISWSPWLRSYNQYNKLLHFGTVTDSSLDSTVYPGDHDGDGICNMLEVATLDYGSDSLIFEMEMSVSYAPEYPAMMPTGVAISPSLPAGLTLNTTTGEISGRVTSTDFIGSTYTISTTSDVEAWNDSITIKSTMENPLYTGYQTLFTNSYSDQTSAKTAFAGNGEIVTLERYTSTSSIQVDGVDAGGNHDNNDIVLSMRDPTGDYIWAKSIRGNTFYIEDVDVDDNGNIYALFQATAHSSDPVVFNFDGVTIDNNGKETVILAKWDYYGNLQWAINTESTGTSTDGDLASISRSSDDESSEMDLDKSTGDVAIIAKGRAVNDDLKFGGMQIGPFGTCLSTIQPWVAKVNTNGQVQWTSVGKSDPTNCRATDEHQVVLHHDGSVTTAGHVNPSSNGQWDYDFGSSSAAYSGGNYAARASSWIAHADSSGNWLWAENVTTESSHSSESYEHYFTMDKYSDDTLFFAYVSSRQYCTDLEFAGSSTGSMPTQINRFCLHVATMNHTTSDVISLETRIGYHYTSNTFRSNSIYSAVDSDDIAHVLMDMSEGHDLRTTGFDKDLNMAYDVASSQWSSNHYTTDFGLDNSGSIYITGYHGAYHMFRTASLLNECDSDNIDCSGVRSWSSGQSSMYASQHYLNRFWGDFDHEINYNSPSEGASSSFGTIGYHNVQVASYTLNDSAGNYNTAALPCGLSFTASSGRISGTPSNGCTDTANETYTISAWYGSSYSQPWNRLQSFEVTFGIGPTVPVVSYNSADTTQTYTRGVAITPIAPTGITNSANLDHFTTYPPLPAGLSVNSTGHITGTPTANQSTAIFKVKSCNSWNICSEGVPFTITINEPTPVISYPDSEYEFFKDVPIAPVVPTNTGGVPSSWEVSPDLPTGMSLRGDGAIVGIPFVDSLATDYTIYANNSGGTGTTVIEITINGTGVFINYPYNTAELAQYSPMMALYPSTSGAAVVSWSIDPTLPTGLFFGTNNGTIWGTPNTLAESAVHTINASGVDDFGIATVTISVLLDTDLDSIPDINDDDIDGDGWTNIDETNCQTDEMDVNDYPSDIDQDRICDLLDTNDDRAIIVVYLANDLELVNDTIMSPLVPITAGGDIDTWEITPALPLGLDFNGTMPGRSSSFTGIISGTPTEISSTTVYTIWANNTNSEQSGMFQITISVLVDTDGDGIPDVEDGDIDGDSWSNEMEVLCARDPLDENSTPIDTDGDQKCNYVDDDDDDDTYIDTDEILCNSDPTDATDVPIDLDNDGICDALQSDIDLDGWADGTEEACGSDPNNASSIPVDSDGDGICDDWDDDRDGDNVGNTVDDFPDDPSASRDTDGDGKPDSILGTSEFGLEEDFDDDNDNWTDYQESLCGTNSLDESEFPTDSDGDGICDALEEDRDGDDVVDGEDAFPDDPNEWRDTDGDGIGDNADTDDDGDNWLDSDENDCGTDPLDAESMPVDEDQDGVCEQSDVNNQEPNDNDDTSTMLWILVCCPFLLLLLLIPLIYRARDRGESLLVLMGMRNGPEPENTTAEPEFISGSGTKNDPYVLRPAHVENFGDDATSEETVTITNLDPDTLVSITDMASNTNRGRFNMDPILVEGAREEKGSGAIVFQLNFDDNVTEDQINGKYEGQIRVGSSSVYILWQVTVGDPELEAAAQAKEAEEKAAKEAEKEESERKLREAESKAAEAEAKAIIAEEKAAKEKKARENAEDAARLAAEEAAKERLAQMEKEMDERRAKLAEMDETTRKKEEELLRISEKAKTIDFATIGVADKSQKDDLKKIKGVGPFIEDKLNALGIYTFSQVGNMTAEIEEQVNVAIEFFPGRIRRDEWAKQARKFDSQK